jgi:hypothetical protein
MGLDPRAVTGVWVPGIIQEASGGTYEVRVDRPLDGRTDYPGITEDRLDTEENLHRGQEGVWRAL